MKATEFVSILKKIANGDYGATNYGDKNHKAGGKYSLGYYDPSLGKFCFDCCGVIKAVVWGWNGDKNAAYGGAVYKSNGMPDINDQGIHDVSNMQEITEVSKIKVGAPLWKQGHVGVYIGNGETVECTTNGKASVQFGTVRNYGARTVSGVSCGNWTHYGLLPYIDYDTSDITDITGTTTIDDVVTDIIAGKYGNGDNRKTNLYNLVQGYVNTAVAAGITGTHCATTSKITTMATLVLAVIAGDFGNGDNRKNNIYRLFQDRVNEKAASKSTTPTKTAREVAEEIVNGTGNWGNGSERKTNLEKAGYNYREVQDIVNELCKSSKTTGEKLVEAMAEIATLKKTYDGIGGCSAYLRAGLEKAGCGSYTGNEIWAIKDNHSGLDKIADRLPWGTTLKAGDILWSAYHHIAVWAGDGHNSLYEAAPENTHSLATNGTGVGLHYGHGTYNCGTGGNTWTCIYRLR